MVQFYEMKKTCCISWKNIRKDDRKKNRMKKQKEKQEERKQIE